jgi:hypothetical protein
MLKSLEIKNFRTFAHLVVERLARVNLVVGKNNVGKTTLLEALRLYGSIWPVSAIASILNERNDITTSADDRQMLLLDSLFHGRSANENDEICIGQLTTGGRGFSFHATASVETVVARFPPHSDIFYEPGVRFALNVKLRGKGTREFTVSPHGGVAYTVPSGSPKPPEFAADPPCLRGVGSQPHFENAIAHWWDAVALTDAEDRIMDALQIVAPIEGVSFVADPRPKAGRVARVRIRGTRDPAPLATLGDGVVRMFQIAVAMEYAAVRAKNILDADRGLENSFPLLLIDEVETGIHHTLHADLWRFIFKTARLLDVQVFATTHSHDCLRGFAEAVADDEEADGQVIRLERDADEEATRAIVVGREKLPIVVRDSIEVR